MSMVKNMSKIDRFVRFFIGAGLIYLGFFYVSLTNYAFINILVGIFGVINFVSAISAVCPVYSAVGISTCKKNIDN